MSEPIAATIYATQLSTLKEGFPLWDPSPGSQAPVEVADIGYIEYGAWSRLFNASKPPSDPSNILGVPDGFRPLVVGEVRERSSLLARVPIRSDSVEQRTVDLSVSAGPGVPAVQAGGGFNFKCSKEHGAVLLLGDHADRRDAFRKEDFARYIIEHGATWLRFANDIQKRGIMLDDLVLVTGCDKTSSWACAAFSKESSEAGVSFNVGQPGIANGSLSISWTWNNCSSVATRSGPPIPTSAMQHLSYENIMGLTDSGGDVMMTNTHAGEIAASLPPTRDQCVFLRGYKVCDRKTWRARHLLRLKQKYDGFEHIPQSKRRDNTEGPRTGSSKRAYFSAGQDTSGGSQHSQGNSTRSDTTLGDKPSKHSGPTETPDRPYTGSSTDGTDYELPLQMYLGQYKEPILADVVLGYILENSKAELALVHDDDIIALLDDTSASITDFEIWIKKFSPDIYINNQVGMLETTHYTSLLNIPRMGKVKETSSGMPIVSQKRGSDILTNIYFNQNLQNSKKLGHPSEYSGRAFLYSPKLEGTSPRLSDACDLCKELKLDCIFVSRSQTCTNCTRRGRDCRRVSDGKSKRYLQSLDSDDNSSSVSGKSKFGRPRHAGACDPCKQSQVKCVFTVPGQKCRRCANGGHECCVFSSKQKPRPPSQDELLARLRQKDGVILSLLLLLSSSPTTIAPLGDDTSLSSSPTSIRPLPPIPVWDKRTPKPEVDRRVAAWIAEARRRVNGVDPVVENAKGLVIDRARVISNGAISISPDAPCIAPQRASDILQDGLVTPQEVETLFRIFFDKINLFFTICDPVLHTPTRVFRTSPFLFTTVCAIASRHYIRRPALYPTLLHTAKSLAGSALNGPKSVETCQAYLLLGVHYPPPRKSFDDCAFLFIGLAIRLAMDLELHKPQVIPVGATEEEARSVLNRARLWLNCFCTDQSICMQLGKPSALGQKGEEHGGDAAWVPYELKWWWRGSTWNGPHDIHICAYANLLQVVSGFHKLILGRNTDKKSLDLSLVQLYTDKIIEVGDDWTWRLAQNSTLHPHPATTWQDNLWPFLVSYAKLVVLSVGLEDGMRQGLRRGNPFAEQCVRAAMDVVIQVTGPLAQFGYLRYCAEAHFVYMGFAAAFLLKILRSKFTFMLPPGRTETILTLVQRLIEVLGSKDVVLDQRHTPRHYARFLEAVITGERERLGGKGSEAQVMHASGVEPALFPERELGSEVSPSEVHRRKHTQAQRQLYTPPTSNASPPFGMDTDADVMLHSMAGIMDPNFWETGTMPGWDGLDPQRNNCDSVLI